MKKITLIIISTFFILDGYCCLNEYNINERGQENDEFSGIPIFYRSFDEEYSQKIVSSVDLSKKENIDYKKLSDVGVHLSHLGKYKQALQLFIWLHERHKNEYQIVANLGTLYELNGQVDSAFKYIEKAMKLNPDSHYGSEWVHLAILNAKREISLDKNWILNHQVLNLGLTDTVEYYSVEQDHILDTIMHIGHQLVERIPFTPDDDLIVANILNELGDLLRIHISIENAFIAYKIAEHYDVQNHYKVSTKINKLKPLFKKYEYEEAVFKEHFPPKESFRKKENETEQSEQNKKSKGSLIFYLIGGVFLLIIITALIKRKRSV